MHKILIFTEQITPRIQYVFDFLFREFSGLEIELTTNIQFFEPSDWPKINFSTQPLKNAFQLLPDKILFEKGIDESEKFENLNAVGKVFFALSRYEEYFPHEKDQHGRILGRGKVYKIPIVDQIALEIQSDLKKQYPFLTFKERNYGLTITCDVDHAWKYKNKGFKRNFATYLKLLLKRNWEELSERKSVLEGKKEDTYDTFEFFQNLKEKSNVKMVFFWLMGDWAKYDKNTPVTNLAFQQKIREVANWAEIGIHPSYASNFSIEKLKKEKERLENLLKRKITQSRQHFLKLSFPETYRNLIEIGIREDYTMAYADETGFRAGTSTSFLWYDLLQEKMTDLKLFPFCVMDVTLRNYMKLSIEEAKTEIIRLESEVRKVNGEMSVLFHNSNLKGDWEGWEEVLERLVCKN